MAGKIPSQAESAEEMAKVISVKIEEAVRDVLGPVISETAARVIEEVAWDVIPELAEAMIKSEIERITKREGGRGDT
jgi:3-deoxy-D-manno-octulosonate 8-phosphate phosphatase KdsC-like HAD superfamily phosphatase